MQANKSQISDIFNRDRLLEIPFFQRSYVWKEEQWERFLDDMVNISEETKPYFFGSLIFKQQETPTRGGVGDVRTVIDGQQRLTTLIIFYKVLSLKKGDHRMYQRFQLDESGVALSHSINDAESFKKVTELDELANLANADFVDNIVNAYNFFNDRIDPDEINEDAIRQNAYFIVIDLSKDDDEQQIFDTLNSLGVRLTTAELLKNFLFRRDDMHLYETHWLSVFEKDSETKKYWDREIYAGRDWRAFIDLFFFAYLQVKVQNESRHIKQKDREEFQKLENLFSSYKKLMNDYGFNKESILQEIGDYANLFRSNFDTDAVNVGLENSPGMQRINTIIFGLDTTTLVPYILFVVANTKDNAQRKDLFRAIESFIMRRLTVRSNNRGYSQLFLGMISERILTSGDFYEFIKNRSSAASLMPDDKELKDGFNNSNLTNKAALGVLYFIESHGRDEKYSINLMGMAKYSLEHLMPKNWEKNWDKLEDPQKADERRKKLLTLGNLAMITQRLNASIRDSAWVAKKDGGLVRYASGIDIHHDFINESEWDEGKIAARANELFKKARKIWPLK